MKPNLAAAVIALLLWVQPAPAQDAAARDAMRDPVVERVVEIVRSHFYDPDGLDGFEAALQAMGEQAGEGAIDALLAALGVSHTAHYTPDRLDYYELSDIFRAALRGDSRRLFPPEGRVTYPGIGIATALLDGGRFVTDVYDGGPADQAGLLPGDEILAVEGRPFAEIAAFEGRVGETVRLEVRRRPGAAPIDVPVRVAALNPSDVLGRAIESSARVIERDGRRLGYVRLWSHHRPDTGDRLGRLLALGPLAGADGLVLDLRGRWGGAPADAAEIFVGGTPGLTMVSGDGSVRAASVRWDRPVVALIDEGTRSGLEIYAHALQRNGIRLVGERTAGAVLAGTAFLLPDDSLLVLAVADVLLDGLRLEGVGVEPDLRVPFDIRYAAGEDPQREAALAELLRLLAQL